MRYYSAIGSVRGDCGHAHRSIETAEACRRRDAEGCRAQGGYSDRSVCVQVGTRHDAEIVTPSESEALDIEAARCGS